MYLVASIDTSTWGCKRIRKKNLHFSRLNYKNIKEQQRKIKNASHFTQNLFTECGNKIKLTNERKEEMDKKERLFIFVL